MAKSITTAAILCATILAGALSAQAGVIIEAVQTTTVNIPETVDPRAQLVIDEDGEVFLLSDTPGSGISIFPVTLGEGGGDALYFDYEDQEVALSSWTFGPDNDFILRGNVVQPGADPVGVTARLGRDGEVNWAVLDEVISQDEEFLGSYLQATGPVVWSPIAQRVMVFTEASFEIASVSQASMLFEFNGDLRDASVLFGTEYVGAALNNALRTPDGKYLVYYFSQNDPGTRFFIYDGVSNISFFEPEGGDWTQREVHQVQYDAAGNLVLLWTSLEASTDPDLAAIKTNLTKLDPDGKLLWEQDISGSVLREVEEDVTGLVVEVAFDLLRPVFMIAADEEIVLLRQVADTFLFDVRDGDDGSPAGFWDFFSLTENTVFDLKFLAGSDRNYLLSTVNADNPAANEVLQVKLRFNNSPVPIGENVGNGGGIPSNNDAGNNGPLVEEPDPIAPNPGDVTVGCGCTTTPARAPMLPMFASLLAVVGLVLTRRRKG